MQLSDAITTLAGISDGYASKLHKLGINTIADLLTYFPRRLQDNSEVHTITSLQAATPTVLKGQITKIRSIRLKGRGGRTMQTALLTDDETSIQLMWFNQPFLEKAIKSDAPYLVKGRAKQVKNKWVFYPELLEELKQTEDTETVHLGRLTPVYGLTGGLSIKWLRTKVKHLIDYLDQLEDLPHFDFLTQPLQTSLQQIHFPDSEDEFAKAAKDLSLLELVDLGLKMRKQAEKQEKLPAFPLKPFTSELNKLLRALPWELTADQTTAIEEVINDLQGDSAGQRLLQGDVGSGKTIVAIAASLAVAAGGGQVAVLAPTTILAQQHYQNFSNYLTKFGVSIELVTGGTKDTKPAQILIGTAAILARKHNLISNLTLVIVDEQHRFGVRQREELLAAFHNFGDQKYQPHLLNMTATPIPRTLALALFNHLQVSTINTKPQGRLPIKTFIVPSNKRDDSYRWIEEQVAGGAQVYWICPLVSESETSEAKAATATFNELQQIYPNVKIELLHGKMKADQKEQALQKFASGEVPMLVSTSVIEVGIDVPLATIIVIEGAERFGLAQLHQLRGRVGRNNLQSWCFLFTTDSEPDPFVQERLQHFANYTDGLEIAMYDLKHRGPGEVYGTKQAGIPDLKIAKLDNIELIKQSQEIANNLYTQGVKDIVLYNKIS